MTRSNHPTSRDTAGQDPLRAPIRVSLTVSGNGRTKGLRRPYDRLVNDSVWLPEASGPTSHETGGPASTRVASEPALAVASAAVDRFGVDAREGRVAVSGEVDLSVSEELHRALAEACRPGSDLEVDLTGVSFIDSSGVHSLLRALAALDEDCRMILLIPQQGVVTRVLDILGVEGVPEVEVRRLP